MEELMNTSCESKTPTADKKLLVTDEPRSLNHKDLDHSNNVAGAEINIIVDARDETNISICNSVVKSAEVIPVSAALAYGRKEMASFISSKTDFEAFDTSTQYNVEYFEKETRVSMKRIEENRCTALHMLARKPYGIIGSSSELSIWKRRLNFCFKGIYTKALMQTLAHQVVERVWQIIIKNLTIGELKWMATPSRVLHNAARVGNVEFLIILIRSYPPLLKEVDDDNKSIFHVAVDNRQENVFTLMFNRGYSIATRYDKKDNSNMLHLACKLAAPSHLKRVSGAAIQFQRELMWFKPVEKIVEPSEHDAELSQLTPRSLFTREHEQLAAEGKEHMKNTAKSCILALFIILTSGFVLPLMMLKGNREIDAFSMFAILEYAAGLCSTSSLLSFLHIWKMLIVEDDFLVRLPATLFVGLCMLFLSGLPMVAAFFMAYYEAKAQVLLVAGAVPIAFVYFCVSYFQLLGDILHSFVLFEFYLKRCNRKIVL